VDGRVAHLHSRYRVFGARGEGARALTARLEAIKRERLAATFSDSLEAALGGEETVYVLRRVRARVGLTLGETTTDTRVANRWGEQLAGAVVRALTSEDGTNLVRFDSQADYVAQFVAALLNSDAWGRWYFSAFAPLRADTAPATLRRVLLDNRRRLAHILARLGEAGALGPALDSLDSSTRRELWEGAPHDEAPTDEVFDGGTHAVEAPGGGAESVRPLYALALALVEDFGAWGRNRVGEELLEVYLQTSPPAPDWRDPRALAVALFDVLLFFDRRGLLSRKTAVGLPETFERALAKYDWLDAGWLKGALVELHGGSREAARLPARLGATPRQRELLRALDAVVGEGARPGTGGAGDDLYAGALRLYAALVGREPRWADDAAAKTTIQHLLAVRQLLLDAARPEALARSLRQGDAEGALHAVAEEGRASTAERHAGAAAAIHFVAALGEPAVALLEKLDDGWKQTRAHEGVGVESACAGASLLLRAIFDARLNSLDSETGGVRAAVTGEGHEPAARLTTTAKLIAALGLRLFGAEAATAVGSLDEGLCLLAGLDGPLSLDELREAWASDEACGERLQGALLKVAAGQRLLRADVMHVYKVELEGGEAALVAADEGALFWPLGCVVGEREEASGILAAWLDSWEAASGVRPRVVVGEGVAVEDAAAVGVGPGAAGEELSSLHESGRAALREALAALDGGRLGAARTDLSIALTTCSLLRLWARWLRNFSASGVPYLVEQFLRRRGRLYAGRDALTVELERAPLDVVLETAGYLAELERVPWLGGRRLRFRLRGA